MKLSYKKKMQDIKTDINIANQEYKKMKKELNNSIVYSELNGKVKSVRSIKKATTSKPMVVVSAGGGYLINGSVNEYEKDTIKNGMKVTIEDYMSGATYEGRIIKISNMPTENSGYSFNPNVTFYPYTVMVDGKSDLEEGNWVNLKIDKEQTQTEKGFFMTQAFVLEENGKYYVYKENNDKELEKVEVKVTKIIDGMYFITSGLSRKERVAFPYGKTVKNGAPTTDGYMEDFYMY